jgi:hypothetical protein
VQHVSCDVAGLPLDTGTLGFLRGHWLLAREISDHRTRRTGTFIGRASFLPSDAAAGSGRLAEAAELEAPGQDPGARLAYREQGELTLGGHRGPAWRELILLGTRDGAADVLFADGRGFYRLDLRSGYWQARHPCAEDSYLVTVTVLGADSFTESWRVLGPAKDYTMTATLTRTGEHA